MSDKYFEDLKKLILLQVELTKHPCEIDENDEWLIEILKQIARDQREADRKAIMQLQEKWNKEHTPTYRDNQNLSRRPIF